MVGQVLQPGLTREHGLSSPVGLDCVRKSSVGYHTTEGEDNFGLPLPVAKAKSVLEHRICGSWMNSLPWAYKDAKHPIIRRLTRGRDSVGQSAAAFQTATGGKYKLLLASLGDPGQGRLSKRAGDGGGVERERRTPTYRERERAILVQGKYRMRNHIGGVSSRSISAEKSSFYFITVSVHIQVFPCNRKFECECTSSEDPADCFPKTFPTAENPQIARSRLFFLRTPKFRGDYPMTSVWLAAHLVPKASKGGNTLEITFPGRNYFLSAEGFLRNQWHCWSKRWNL
ncbi:hypothetical protein BaRGS_00018572 [Batillaria attramentaria]|uniref:Uncharacterized protein n=1 Tax=Batillaria attramentaria TaxID=370345 RepID=A0ABD0KTV6_9CAEN